MVDIAAWRQSFEPLRPVGIQSTREVTGLCKKALGARSLYAKVVIELSPSDSLTFDTTLSGDIGRRGETEGWLRAAFLGVLDTMLVRPAIPITLFRCIIKSIEYHEIDASRQAFRLAGRYATEAYLKEEKFVTI